MTKNGAALISSNSGRILGETPINTVILALIILRALIFGRGAATGRMVAKGRERILEIGSAMRVIRQNESDASEYGGIKMRRLRGCEAAAVGDSRAPSDVRTFVATNRGRAAMQGCGGGGRRGFTLIELMV